MVGIPKHLLIPKLIRDCSRGYTQQNLWNLIGRMLTYHCLYFKQEKGYALKKNLAELAIAANKTALKKRTQEVDDERYVSIRCSLSYTVQCSLWRHQRSSQIIIK